MHVLPVCLLFIILCIDRLTVDRQKNAADPRSKPTTFSKSTSSGILRKHLYEHHLDVWVAGCDHLKISIKAKEAKPYVEDYRARTECRTAGSHPEPPEKRTQFSQEAFVDAIVEFIVGDDQVSCYFVLAARSNSLAVPQRCRKQRTTRHLSHAAVRAQRFRYSASNKNPKAHH